MRILVLLSLVVSSIANAECLNGPRIPVGPRSVQAQCGYNSADIAASGSFVAAAWMTSRTSLLFGHVITTGATWGGALDESGHLVTPAHAQLNDAPGVPSLATNGQRALLAWSSPNATRARFLDSNDVFTIATAGSIERPARAVWNGAEFLVIYEDHGAVKSARIGSEERVTIAESARLVDANANAIVIETATGLELLANTTRRTLPIPSGAVVALGEDFVAWHAGTIGMMRFDGAPATLANASNEVKRIAVAGDVILWNDGNVVRGTRIGGPGVAGRDGLLHAAALTSGGVVALIGEPCGAVASYLLDPDWNVLQRTDIVSREIAPQWDRTLVPAARGRDVYWEEPHPYERTGQLFVTHFVGSVAGPPVALARISGSSMSDAAPDGGGSVFVWSEYPPGEFTHGAVRLARVDALGHVAPPLTVSATEGFIQDVAVVSDGDVVTVFSIEDGPLWKTTVRGAAVTRELLRADPRAMLVDAVMTKDGPAAVWIDRGNDSALLTIDDANGTRAYPIAYSAYVRDVVAGDTLMVLWTGFDELHAFFPATFVDKPLGFTGASSIATEARADGTFDIALARTEVQIFNITPRGVVTQRDDVCLTAYAMEFTLRAGTVDAALTAAEDNGLLLALRAHSRRHAVR